MAVGLGSGGKRTIWYGVSTGESAKGDKKADSTWNPGRIGPSRRANKDHHARTGKAAQRKATHHYGSFAKG